MVRYIIVKVVFTFVFSYVYMYVHIQTDKNLYLLVMVVLVKIIWNYIRTCYIRKVYTENKSVQVVNCIYYKYNCCYCSILEHTPFNTTICISQLQINR